MKFEIEESDLRRIAAMVVEQLKPVLSVPVTGKSDNASQDEGFMDIPKVCEYLGVSESWVRQRVNNKVFPSYRMEGLIRFKKKDIDIFMKTNRCH